MAKSMLTRAGIALALIAVISSLAVGVAMAAGLVTLTTPPINPAEKVYYNPGTSHPAVFHFIGTYPRYGGKFLQFTWKPYPFATTVHGAYRIQLMQNVTPLAAPTWTPFMVADAWADNPEGPTYMMGPFLREYGLCDACPSKIVVSAETYAPVQTPGTDEWNIVYTPILTVPTNPPIFGAEARRVQESNVFVIETSSQARCDAAAGPDCNP